MQKPKRKKAKVKTQKSATAGLIAGTFHVNQEGTVMYIASCAHSTIIFGGEGVLVELESPQLSHVQRSFLYMARTDLDAFYLRNKFRSVSTYQPIETRQNVN